MLTATDMIIQQPFQSLYIHVPFCRRKCAYCAFYSLPASTPEHRLAYLRRLEREFAEFAGRSAPLHTIFIGGGTPSVLSVRELRQLLELIRSSFPLKRGCEFTMECNPDSLTAAKIEAMAGAGVNRVSLGIQSFQPRFRRMLGRSGSLRRLPALIRDLEACGIRNLGFDLIYAIPGQTLAAWTAELVAAFAFPISHLSTYALTLEEGTRLARAGLVPVSDDLAADLWEAAGAMAGKAGFRRYEISNFARPGRECRHNLEIWYGGTYLGCGPAASSFDGAIRWSNPATLEAWLAPQMKRLPDPLPETARAAEILAFGLRTVRGWSRALFRQRTGYDYLDLRGDAIAPLVRAGLLAGLPARLRPTRRGLLLHDAIAENLL